MYRTFDKVRERGNIGIPCFVKEDGSVIISLKHYDSSLAEAAADHSVFKSIMIAGRYTSVIEGFFNYD